MSENSELQSEWYSCAKSAVVALTVIKTARGFQMTGHHRVDGRDWTFAKLLYEGRKRYKSFTFQLLHKLQLKDIYSGLTENWFAA